MPGNTFGHALRVTTFGESHGPALGCVVDGCPAGVPLDEARIAAWLDRRRPGQSALTSARAEPDRPRLLSGVYQGLTLGSPIAVLVESVDARPADYAQLMASGRDDGADQFRPGHADFTWQARYGFRDPRGGGRASARETVGRVAAGAIAEALLDALADAEGRPRPAIVAWVQQVGSWVADAPAPETVTDPAFAALSRGHAIDPLALTRADVDGHPTRCPDPTAAAAMAAAIADARAAGDSLGGVVRCIVRGLPAGWGDPVFDKLTGVLAHALCSLPAVKGVEFGSGFRGAILAGSVHDDPFDRLPSGGIGTRFNHAGGMLGGITTGMPLLVDVAFKPPSTIAQPRAGIGLQGPPTPLTMQGRHDPCVLPRAVVLVEAAIAIVLADAALRGGRMPGGPSAAPPSDPDSAKVPA